MARKKYTHELDEDLYERFKRVAKENDSTAVQEIRKFIKEYLSKNSQLALKQEIDMPSFTGTGEKTVEIDVDVDVEVYEFYEEMTYSEKDEMAELLKDRI